MLTERLYPHLMPRVGLREPGELVRTEVVDSPDGALTLSEAKNAVRYEDSDEDTLIQTLITSATEAVGRHIGRALTPRTLKAVFFAPQTCVALPFPPAVELVEDGMAVVRDGVATPLDETDYWLSESDPALLQRLDGGDLAGSTGSLSALGRCPIAAYLQVQYKAGYGHTDPTSEALPDPLKVAVQLLVGDLFEHRQTLVLGTVVARMPELVKQMVEPFIVVDTFA